MSEKAPLTQVITIPVEPVSTAGNDLTTVLCAAPFAGTVTGATYTPLSDVTGAATNFRKGAVVNTGADGDGTTEVAAVSFESGTDAAQFVAVDLTLSGTAANLAFDAGDVLVWASTGEGTGMADPGGTVTVTLSRS